MKQEAKELLLKDLCSRLPYRVKIELTWRDIGEGAYINTINTTLESGHIKQLLNDEGGDTEIKPYLFPLSSMTEEQKRELEELHFGYIPDEIFNDIEFVYHYDCMHLIDWLNKNHLDYRGLIPMGLANDATSFACTGVAESPLRTFPRVNEFEAGASYRR